VEPPDPPGGVSDRRVRPSLPDHLDEAYVAGATIPIGSLERQSAYELFLCGERDFEDVAHLFLLFRETLSTDRHGQWVGRLDVTAAYERLESIGSTRVEAGAEPRGLSRGTVPDRTGVGRDDTAARAER
jgi:hypothetical protein